MGTPSTSRGTMPFEKLVVIDARNHLLGRLASFVAKEARLGQKVVLVRCEDMVISGSFIRNKMKLLMKRNKRMNTNPVKGPFHHRSQQTWSCELFVECSHTSITAVPPPSSALSALRVSQS